MADPALADLAAIDSDVTAAWRIVTTTLDVDRLTCSLRLIDDRLEARFALRRHDRSAPSTT